MGRYVVRRLLQFIPVILGSTFIIYYLMWALPGNPFAGKCGERPCPASYVRMMTEKFNLNDPLLVQYFKYIGNVFQGNLGETFSGVPVIEQLQQAYPVTLRLAIIAILFETIIGMSAGVVAGRRRGGVFDHSALLVSLALIAVPLFVIGFLLQYLFGIKFAIIDPTVAVGAPTVQLILPGFVLATTSIAYITRLTRSSIIENSRADFMRTAVAKGLKPGRTVGVHLLRNSVIPVITFIGGDLGALIGGTVVVEGIFNIQGVGGLLFQSIRTRQGATVVGVVTVLVIVYLVINLLVDLFYAVLDPRIRYD